MRSTPWSRLSQLLALGFIVLNVLFALRGGRVVGDAVLYVTAAEDLRQGQPVPEMIRSRLAYIGVIAACQALGLGLGGVVAIQLVAGIGASVALYDLGRRLGGAAAGYLAAAMMLVNPDLVRWHWYLLTDSLYTSAIVLTTWCIHTASGRGKVGYLRAGVALVLSALLRPNGWLLVLVALCYWFGRRTTRTRVRVAGLAVFVGGFVAGFFLLLTLRPGLLTNAPDTLLRRGEVIWGYEAGRLTMPDDEAGATGLPGMAAYAVRHPLACVRLGAARVFTELAHTRPFYSRTHNLVFWLVLPPLYALTVIGFLARWRQPLARLLVAVIVGHLSIQAVNYADWDGRFLLYVFPLIGVLGACGLMDLMRRFARHSSPARL